MTASVAKRLITNSIHGVLNELEPAEAIEVAEWIESEVRDIVGELRDDATFVQVAAIPAFEAVHPNHPQARR